MRVMIVSNGPWVSSGYGVQTKLLTAALEEMGHDVGIVAFYGLEGAATYVGKTMVYPGGALPYGQDVIAAHCRHFKADIAISLIDVWVYSPDTWQGVRWLPWFPLDCAPMPEAIRLPLSYSWQPVAMSRFGEGEAREHGLDVRYVPLAFDRRQYAPASKSEARANPSLKWPDDRWIVGVVAKNASEQDRKAFGPQIAAFAEFQRRHPDALLYLHTDVTGGGRGFNWQPALDYYGLKVGRDVLLQNPYVSIIGADERVMASVFNGIDVLLAVSMGEGFGVPIVEAQACGRPVIAGDWTAMGELVRAGWRMPVDDTEPYYSPIGAFMRRPRVGAIVDLLHAAYQDCDAFDPAEVAREVDEYEINHVAAAHWTPLLAEVAGRIAAPPQQTVVVARGLS